MIYLGDADRAFCAIVHLPAPELARDTVVILCPPFGWDEVCSYRSRGEWARMLADSGYPTARLSYPSTGDSAGSARDPDRIAAWTDAVNRTATYLLASTGARRSVAIGIELGGLIAYRAASGGAPIDDLVLWGAPGRGRTFVRQLRAFSRLEAAQVFADLPPPPPLPDGELEAGGFLLSAQSVRELESLELTSLLLADAPGRRLLLLERDGIAVDDVLLRHLRGLGAAVTVAPGPGYAAMASHPQTSEPPLAVIRRVTEWLSAPAAPGQRSTARALPAPAGGRAQMQLGGEGDCEGEAAPEAGGAAPIITEMPFTVEQPFGKLAGVLALPEGAREPGLCVVLLNAGAVRHIGPNRMWVEAARRWAARGVPTLRLDVEGIGDADGDGTPYAADASLYVPELVPQVLATLDALQERGVGDRFVLAGLCAGAYWSFHAALRDPRVTAALMINPIVLIWDPALAPARDFRALLTKRFSLSKLRREASAARIRRLLVWMLAAPGRWILRVSGRAERSGAGSHELDRSFQALIASGKRGLLLFSCDEELHEELVRAGRMAALQRAPNMTIERLMVRDHTMRPTWAQRQAHAVLDRVLEREIEINRDAQPPGHLRSG